MNVEVDAPDQRAVPEHLVRLDIRMPCRQLRRRPERHIEQSRGDVHDTGADALVRKVRSDLLRIEVVGSPSDLLGVVAAVPGLDRGSARNVHLFPPQQLCVLARRLRARCQHDLVEKLGYGGDAAGHAGLRVIVGPRPEAEDRRNLVTDSEHPAEHLDVVGNGHVPPLDLQPPAKIRVACVGQHRLHVDIVGGQRDRARDVGIPRGNEVSRQPLELRSGGPNDALAFQEVPAEVLGCNLQ